MHEIYHSCDLNGYMLTCASAHRNIVGQEHPRPLRPFIPEMEDFARHNHFNVLHPVLRLLALGLELPEDTLVKTHNFDAKGETSGELLPPVPNIICIDIAVQFVL